MIPHPERIALHNEIHARPRPRVSSPCLVSHLALIRPPGAAASPAALRELCLQYGIAPPGDGQSHFFGDFARFRLKWERHGEFDDYTVYRNLMRADDPFGEPAIDALPSGWLAGVEGQLVAAVHVALVPDGPQWAHRDRIAAALGASDLIGADLTDGAAVLYTDLHLDPNGYTRFLLVNRSMNASLAGRHLQRLLELEVYRMMAMLGFPVARGAAAELNELERGLGKLVSRLESAPAEEEPEMLNEVTRLAALAERIASETGFRAPHGPTMRWSDNDQPIFVSSGWRASKRSLSFSSADSPQPWPSAKVLTAGSPRRPSESTARATCFVPALKSSARHRTSSCSAP